MPKRRHSTMGASRGSKRRRLKYGRRKRRQRSKFARRVKSLIMKTCETKHAHYLLENQQLMHNLWDIRPSLLRTAQGLKDLDGDQAATDPPAIRDGDELYLKNINVRLWLSTKGDRKNVMYRMVLFTYPTILPPTAGALVYGGGGIGNNILRRYNTDKISILKHRLITLNSPIADNGKETSHFVSMNFTCGSNWRIQYEAGGQAPKGKDVGFAIVAYDAYGTQQTDNIASYAFDIKVAFKDP